MVRIPSEYQEVEYIESTGTQYIDLPFGFDPTDEVETRFSISIDLKQWNDKYMVSPTNWNTDNNRFAMGVHGGNSALNTGYYTVGYGGNSTVTTKLSPETLNDGEFHEWEYKDYVFSVSGVDVSKNVSSITFGSTTANLRLFYGYKTNTKGKIAHYHHQKEDGTEINLIPCYRKSDNKIGMYDTVTGTFYTNQGAGTFLKGNDVTYDPISLLETRRKILLNTPHIESASGYIATFNTDMSANLTDMKIHFHPVQEGTGDPSPDNVRPITGWDGLTVYHSGSDRTTPLEIPISFGRTIYGGYVDLVKGEVVETTHYTVLDGENIKVNKSYFNSGVNAGYVAAGYVYCSPYGISNTVHYCDRLKRITTGNTIISTTPIPVLRQANVGVLFVTIVLGKMEDYPDVATGTQAITAVNEWLKDNPVGFTYDLTAPVTYQLDSVTIRTLRGLNNIWSDTNGNIEVKFWKH